MKNVNNIDTKESKRSWFCVWNNPQKYYPELTEQEIVNKAISLWVENKPKRTCAVSYELADTGTPHLHLVLEDPAKSRFSALQKLYPGIHIKETQGTKAEVLDYMYKVGKHAEKNHTIVIPPVFHGEINAKLSKQDNILDSIQDMIQEGYTPKEIMRLDIRYRKHEVLIKKAYFDKRNLETPPIRNVNIRYHVGESGTGKSYTYVNLCEELGEEAIYLVSDHSENGAFDFYYGQPNIFIDELRYMKYEILLQIMDKYKVQIHCRYENAWSLWSQVDITSILPPEKLYENIVPSDRRSDDSFEQLKRRINTVVYHYKCNTEYKMFELDGQEYTNYENLVNRAMAAERGNATVVTQKSGQSLSNSCSTDLPDGFLSVDTENVAVPFN